MIHLVGPVLLAAALAGTGVYGLIARRNAVLVLIGAELVLNAANLLLVTAGNLPAGGLAGLRPSDTGAGSGSGSASDGAAGAIPFDPLLSGQVMTIFVITIAAAEIGLALAVVLLLYRRRATSDLGEIRDLGEASPTYRVPDRAGTWPVMPGPAGGDGPGDGGAGPGDGGGGGREGHDTAAASRQGAVS